ncbi:hypothetical protein DPMN_178984 [Dreissena polymorpha]|uniref:Uncharacterized protein n=1 Tax=Dreissena polymorpha TaxID=45954 RepID=A0A9D4EBY9_DREPO|nr:hypothetical protein DPMN_178984 [Dreissena polymorpha]
MSSIETSDSNNNTTIQQQQPVSRLLFALNMPSYKLSYFDVRVRAELSSYLFLGPEGTSRITGYRGLSGHT